MFHALRMQCEVLPNVHVACCSETYAILKHFSDWHGVPSEKCEFLKEDSDWHHASCRGQKTMCLFNPLHLK